MTEAFEKWVDSVPYFTNALRGDYETADYWLRAFVREVMTKTAPYDDNGMLETHIGFEFVRLVRKFGLDGEK